MARSVEEWVGKTDDTKVPPRVKLRVLQRYDSICYLSKRPIRDGDLWDADHKVSLILGGENRESNLVPVLKEFHKAKTKAEMKIKAKIARVAKAAAGLKPKGKGWPKKAKVKWVRDKLPMPSATLNPLWRGRAGQLHAPIGGEVDD
jgi:hypothetical protein